LFRDIAMNRTLAVPFLFLALGARGWSQADSSSGGQTPWHPTTNGQSGSLAFASEAERTNQLSGGLTLSSTYDDNALSSPAHPVGNVGYLIMPNLSIVEVRARSMLNLNYDPGFLWNQRLSSRYQAEHNLDFNWQYRLTERVSARIHDGFIDQSTSFNQLNGNPLLPGGNILSQPNQSVLTPLANQRTNVTNVDLADQIGEGTNIGVTGNFNKLDFRDPSDSPVQLFNNESWSGEAFYSHHLSERNTIGATYTFQKIATFGAILEHSQSQNVLLFYTVNLKPGVTVSVFAGPDRSTTSTEFQLAPGISPINFVQSMWLVDEGATFSWQGQRNSVRMNLIHHVTDGGGLNGAVQLYSANLVLRRQLSRAWTGDVALNYGDNNPLSHFYGNAFVDLGGTIGLNRTFGEHFTVGMRYGRDLQRYREYGISSTPGFSANHNQAWITVTYHFSRPLGG
jgi:hypothetical protein